jgi:hypothetical protein
MSATKSHQCIHPTAYARRHPALSLFAFAAVIAVAFWIRSYLGSPYRVVRLASAALASRDADALVALASDSELKQLHISPGAVKSCLQESVWQTASAVGVTVKNARPRFGDVLIFAVDFASDIIPGGKRDSEIWVYQDAAGHWRLALSHLLYCLHQASGDPNVDHAKEFDAAALRAGMLGCTLPGASTRWAEDGSHSNDIQLTGN